MLGQLGIMKEVAKFIAKKFKLDKMEKIIAYVEGENALDVDVKDMKVDFKNVKEDIRLLKAIAHPPRDFTICDECKCKVVITEHIEERRK